MSSVESSLASQGCAAVRLGPQRAVNFQKGIARMVFKDGSGSITFQNFTLADGQICVKAEFHWTQADAMGSIAVYPTPENFDWFAAAEKIAQAWIAGMNAEAVSTESASAVGDRLVAAS